MPSLNPKSVLGKIYTHLKAAIRRWYSSSVKGAALIYHSREPSRRAKILDVVDQVIRFWPNT